MPPAAEIVSHRLVLPADANHHGTLYAGSLLRYALEAGYAAASRGAGPAANLVLRRVLSVECRQGVPVGTLVELRAAVIEVRQCYLAVAVVGMPLEGQAVPWMDGLMGFVQIGADGLPVPLPAVVETAPAGPLWQPLVDRLERIGRIRGGTADWLGAGLDRGGGPPPVGP
jgi:acyl-CoA thioesterase YciA